MERRINNALHTVQSRREILKGVLTKGLPATYAATRAASGLLSLNIPLNSRVEATQRVIINSPQENHQLPPEPSPLKKYLDSIEGDYNRLLPIVKENDLFTGFKNLTREQQIRDFEIYFPLYKAGEIAQEIPWFLLWIIHVDETTVSTDKNPDQESQRGAMQLLTAHEDKLKDARFGWEFLDERFQRYSRRLGFLTDDWEEILKAALYIRNRVAPGTATRAAEEEAILSVVRSGYSSKEFGEARVKRYHLIKGMLNTSAIQDNPGAF